MNEPQTLILTRQRKIEKNDYFADLCQKVSEILTYQCRFGKPIEEQKVGFFEKFEIVTDYILVGEELIVQKSLKKIELGRDGEEMTRIYETAFWVSKEIGMGVY